MIDSALNIVKKILHLCLFLLGVLMDVLYFDDEDTSGDNSSIHGVTVEQHFSTNLEHSRHSINTHYRWWD